MKGTPVSDSLLQGFIKLLFDQLITNQVQLTCFYLFSRSEGTFLCADLLILLNEGHWSKPFIKFCPCKGHREEHFTAACHL